MIPFDEEIYLHKKNRICLLKVNYGFSVKNINPRNLNWVIKQMQMHILYFWFRGVKLTAMNEIKLRKLSSMVPFSKLALSLNIWKHELLLLKSNIVNQIIILPRNRLCWETRHSNPFPIVWISSIWRDKMERDN